MNTHNPHDFRYRAAAVRRRMQPARSRPCRLPPRSLSSETLFQGSHEIGIEHFGSLYRLKITRQGKLILNK